MEATAWITLSAALIAAVSGIVAVILQIYSSRSGEYRAAYRAILHPLVPTLAENLHQLLAATRVSLHAGQGESSRKWMKRATEARDRLKTLVPRLRYPLDEVDRAVLRLTRLPNWLDQFATDPQRQERLFGAADRLRLEIDSVVRRCYLRGRQPTPREKRRLKRLRNRLEEIKGRVALADMVDDDQVLQ